MTAWLYGSADKAQPLPPAVGTPALHAMISHLSRHVHLDQHDLDLLRGLPLVVRDVAKGRYLDREESLASNYILLLSGYTCRQKMTFEGARQIVSLQMAGDAVSSASMFLSELGTVTQAITPVKAVYVPGTAFRSVIRESFAIRHSLMIMAFIEGSVSQEWLLNIGQRPGKVRVAHLLCEIASRLDAAGLADADGYRLLLTQDQMGDALGLTAIHVNRMLMELGGQGLIIRTGRFMQIPDRLALERVADFSSSYLHNRPGVVSALQFS